jgi:hypothetical protein
MNKAERTEEYCGMAARVVKLAFTAPNLSETVILLRVARDWLVLAIANGRRAYPTLVALSKTAFG